MQCRFIETLNFCQTLIRPIPKVVIIGMAAITAASVQILFNFPSFCSCTTETRIIQTIVGEVKRNRQKKRGALCFYRSNEMEIPKFFAIVEILLRLTFVRLHSAHTHKHQTFLKFHCHNENIFEQTQSFDGSIEFVVEAKHSKSVTVHKIQFSENIFPILLSLTVFFLYIFIHRFVNQYDACVRVFSFHFVQCFDFLKNSSKTQLWI